MKIKVTVCTNKVGSEDYDYFECDDDSTESDIQEFAKETMFNLISWSTEVVDE